MSVHTEHIQVTADTCGGRPRIAGHRIRVQDVVIWTQHRGWSPQRIVAEFPQLSLAQVHAALTYYYDHQADIDAQILDDEVFYERMKRLGPSVIDQLRRRHGARLAEASLG